MPTPKALNGLKVVSFHALDPEGAKVLGPINRELSAPSAVGGLSAAQLDPESAAVQILNRALTEAQTAGASFRKLGTESVPLTGTRIVKFRQELQKVPVYGSYVSVELDGQNQCLALNAILGNPKNVEPIAKVSPAQAVKSAAKAPGLAVDAAEDAPRLHYYFDAADKAWKLVYIVEDAPVTAKKPSPHLTPAAADFVVDANTGKLIATLPRTSTLEATGMDDLGVARTVTIARRGNKRVLRDDTLRIATYDFGFRDPETQFKRLPGRLITSPFSSSAISAHANASVVSKFLRDTLLRNNIDNEGGVIVSSIQALVREGNPNAATKQWFNAFWNGDQMVYGQVLNEGKLRSLASSLDVVAHEMFHGVTDGTSRLEYVTESGALNESYSDIFGTVIANFANPDIAAWNWEIGERLAASNVPFRDMSDPGRFGQPMLYRQFRRLPASQQPSDANDWGFVHANSGIHNFAAFHVITARDGAGRFLFTAAECAAMFYIALTQHLSRTSQFGDSRRAVLLAAQTLFRAEAPAAREARLAGIEAGFAAAGIP